MKIVLNKSAITFNEYFSQTLLQSAGLLFCMCLPMIVFHNDHWIDRVINNSFVVPGIIVPSIIIWLRHAKNGTLPYFGKWRQDVKSLITFGLVGLFVGMITNGLVGSLAFGIIAGALLIRLEFLPYRRTKWLDSTEVETWDNETLEHARKEISKNISIWYDKKLTDEIDNEIEKRANVKQQSN